MQQFARIAEIEISTKVTGKGGGVCAIGGQHDGHLPFWIPGFVKFIMNLLHVLFACWNKYTTTTTTLVGYLACSSGITG